MTNTHHPGLAFICLAATSFLASGIAGSTVSAAEYPAIFVPRPAPTASSVTVTMSAPVVGNAVETSSLSGSGTLLVGQASEPFEFAQLLDLDLVLDDGMSFSLLGGSISASAEPGAARVRMLESGDPSDVVDGQFDQLQNLFQFEGEISLSTQEEPFDLSTVAPIEADMLGIQLENRGTELVAIFSIDLDFTAAVATPLGQIPLSILIQGNLEAVSALGLLGDFDGNQILNASDIDLVHEAIRLQSDDLQFDLSGNGVVDDADSEFMVSEVLSTVYGDANLDGAFDSDDLIAVFQVGQYEDGVPNNSGWAGGDWNGDGDFTSSDLVRSLQDGCFECGGPRAATLGVPVPEPTGITLFCAALTLLGATRVRP